MSNEYFQFRHFMIHQRNCAMKVGTDGTLLGAWVSIPPSIRNPRILDIGTGTGLIALMIAQRFPLSTVTAIDIDQDAVVQAQKNVEASPFANRITVGCHDIMTYQTNKLFDCVVCNPPYFVDSLLSPDKQRATARHTVSLTFDGLVASASRLLTDIGSLSVILPTEVCSFFETEAYLHGFFLSRLYSVKTMPQKKQKRFLIEFSKSTVNELDKKEVVLNDSTGKRSDWYQQLTHDFYIK